MRLAKRRSQLVLDHLHPGLVADDLLAALDRLALPDIEANRAVELERVAAGRRLRVSEDKPDLLSQLVDEDDAGLRPRDRRGELAQRLAHEARLQPHVRIPHVTVDLGSRRERGDRVDHDQIDRTCPDQGVRDFQRLLAAIRLRHQQVVQLHAEAPRVVGVESVLGVDEGAHAATRLGLRDGVQREGRLSRRLRPVDLDNAAPREAADAESEVDGQRPGRNHLYLSDVLAIQPHDGAIAELLLDDLERLGDGAVLVRCRIAIRFATHGILLSSSARLMCSAPARAIASCRPAQAREPP